MRRAATAIAMVTTKTALDDAPDINWIEVKRQRQHHHRVVGARCRLRTSIPELPDCLSFSISQLP
jgi:hypothetical protein